MKVKILTGALVVSLLLNVAGLVFFILFLDARHDYRSLRRERNILTHNLNMMRTAAVVDDVQQTERIHRRTFRSHVDGDEDDMAVMPPYLPAPRKDLTLVVYLHGMGSSYLEPFYFPQGDTIADALTRSHPFTVVLSCSYGRQASWGNDKALSDITQNIRQVCQEFPVGKIVIMGTSMGGCTSLLYATVAPEDVRAKIAGVVSVESSGDLGRLFNESSHPALKPAMIAALGGSPETAAETYRKKSFLNNIERFPSGARVAVLSARQDDIVPAHMQKEIVSELEKRRVPVKLIEIDGGHGCPPANFYAEGLDFVLQGSAG